MDLALLLGEQSQKAEEVPYMHEGRVILFQTLEQAQRRKKHIHTWSQAFTVYTAALASASSTVKEVSLPTHT